MELVFNFTAATRHFATNQVTWQQASNMIGYKKSISFSVSIDRQRFVFLMRLFPHQTIFLSKKSSSCSPQLLNVYRLLLKEDGVLHSGEHGPVPTISTSKGANNFQLHSVRVFHYLI